MHYLPHTPEDIQAMLRAIGKDSLDALFDSVPNDLKIKKPLQLPSMLTEWELNAHMDALAEQMPNPRKVKSYLGAGCYDHYIPAVIPHLLCRSEFYTAYTPYQPEISQGTLQAIFEYQTLSARLLGMDVANASLYDGASALAESLLMALRITRRKKVAISRLIHPHYRQVVATYLKPTNFELIDLPETDGMTDLTAIPLDPELAGVAIQSPNFFGGVEDVSQAAAKVHANGALLIACFTEPLTFGLFKSPGELGADIVCGEGRSLGIAPMFGGPSLGMMACKTQYVRSMPGRLVGETHDIDGKRGYVLTLSTREQHIRREKATSNICTNNSLCAVAAAMYMALLGETGMRALARLNYDYAAYLKNALRQKGIAVRFKAPTFNEFIVELPQSFQKKYDRLVRKHIVVGLPLTPYYPEYPDHYLLCVTETKSRSDLDDLVKEVTT